MNNQKQDLFLSQGKKSFSKKINISKRNEYLINLILISFKLGFSSYLPNQLLFIALLIIYTLEELSFSIDLKFNDESLTEENRFIDLVRISKLNSNKDYQKTFILMNFVFIVVNLIYWALSIVKTFFLINKKIQWQIFYKIQQIINTFYQYLLLLPCWYVSLTYAFESNGSRTFIKGISYINIALIPLIGYLIERQSIGYSFLSNNYSQKQVQFFGQINFLLMLIMVIVHKVSSSNILSLFVILKQIIRIFFLIFRCEFQKQQIEIVNIANQTIFLVISLCYLVIESQQGSFIGSIILIGISFQIGLLILKHRNQKIVECLLRISDPQKSINVPEFLSSVVYLVQKLAYIQANYALNKSGALFEQIYLNHKQKCQNNSSFPCFCMKYFNVANFIISILVQFYQQKSKQLITNSIFLIKIQDQQYVQQQQFVDEERRKNFLIDFIDNTFTYFISRNRVVNKNILFSYQYFVIEMFNNPIKSYCNLENIKSNLNNQQLTVSDKIALNEIQSQMIVLYSDKLINLQSKNQSINMMQIIQYEKENKSVQIKIIGLMKKTGLFYNYLCQNQINLSLIKDKAFLLCNKQKKIINILNNLKRNSPNSSQVKDLCSIFYEIYCQEKYEYQINHLQQKFEINNESFKQYGDTEEDSKFNNNKKLGYISENQCVIFCSFVKGKCCVNLVTDKFYQFFSSDSTSSISINIKGRNLGEFIPTEINSILNAFSLNSINHIESQFLNTKNRLNFGLDEKGFIFPLKTTSKFQKYGDEVGICYLVKKFNKSSHYILLSKQGGIQATSSSLFQFISNCLEVKISYDSLKQFQITELIPLVSIVNQKEHINSNQKQYYTSILIIPRQKGALNEKNQISIEKYTIQQLKKAQSLCDSLVVFQIKFQLYIQRESDGQFLFKYIKIKDISNISNIAEVQNEIQYVNRIIQGNDKGSFNFLQQLESKSDSDSLDETKLTSSPSPNQKKWKLGQLNLFNKLHTRKDIKETQIGLDIQELYQKQESQIVYGDKPFQEQYKIKENKIIQQNSSLSTNIEAIKNQNSINSKNQTFSDLRIANMSQLSLYRFDDTQRNENFPQNSARNFDKSYEYLMNITQSKQDLEQIVSYYQEQSYLEAVRPKQDDISPINQTKEEYIQIQKNPKNLKKQQQQQQMQQQQSDLLISTIQKKGKDNLIKKQQNEKSKQKYYFLSHLQIDASNNSVSRSGESRSSNEKNLIVKKIKSKVGLKNLHIYILIGFASLLIFIAITIIGYITNQNGIDLFSPSFKSITKPIEFLYNTLDVARQMCFQDLLKYDFPQIDKNLMNIQSKAAQEKAVSGVSDLDADYFQLVQTFANRESIAYLSSYFSEIQFMTQIDSSTNIYRSQKKQQIDVMKDFYYNTKWFVIKNDLWVRYFQWENLPELKSKQTAFQAFFEKNIKDFLDGIYQSYWLQFSVVISMAVILVITFFIIKYLSVKQKEEILSLMGSIRPDLLELQIQKMNEFVEYIQKNIIKKMNKLNRTRNMQIEDNNIFSNEQLEQEEELRQFFQIQNFSQKRKRSIAQFDSLPKLKFVHIILGLILIFAFVFQPILNLMLVSAFVREQEWLLDSKKSIIELIVVVQQIITPQYYNIQAIFNNQDPSKTQYYQFMVNSYEAFQEMKNYQTQLQYPPQFQRHNEVLYEELYNKIVNNDICQVMIKYPKYFRENPTGTPCESLAKGILKKGIIQSYNYAVQQIDIFTQIYMQYTQYTPVEFQNIQQQIQQLQYTQDVLTELNDLVIAIENSAVALNLYYYEVAAEYTDSIANTVLILFWYQLIFVCLAIFVGWNKLFQAINQDLIETKSSLTLFHVDILLQSIIIKKYFQTNKFGVF